MNIQTIKNTIIELSRRHHSIDDGGFSEIKFAEILESEDEDIIIVYCENRNYLINGFPMLKEQMGEDYDEDYFSIERYQSYLYILTYQKEDVADLTWHYAESFWPETFESKEDFITQAKERAESDSFYDVTL